MPRSMVGLLAAVGAAISVVASLAHGDLFWVAVADAAAATGLAAYLVLPPTKKRLTSLSGLAGPGAGQLALLLVAHPNSAPLDSTSGGQRRLPHSCGG